MEIRYKTIFAEGNSDITIEKSRFLGYVKPVSSREEAGLFFSEIRAEHRDARHNVPAYVIGDKMQEQWASDDGEPQGTAGTPILSLLVKEGITNVALMVTRYFGGIKLGPGGLVRAYTKAARDSILDAGIAGVVRVIALRFEIAYPFFDKIRHYAETNNFALGEISYTENVIVQIFADAERESILMESIERITSGSSMLADRMETERKTLI
ncbi:MAG: YigZ family protein [Clostridiales Family XIII bacterium]|jgi:uncharacterized YigZ family protein|nr:YigZ family protein [Clostridiales Family XIII bacterium]